MQLTRIAKADRRTCDFTFNSQRSALAEIVASFPVYRTYIAGGKTSAEDARYVDWAVEVAKKRSQAADTSIFDFVHDVLLALQAQGKREGIPERGMRLCHEISAVQRPGDGQGCGRYDLLSI